jgi:hypothetical protein
MTTMTNTLSVFAWAIGMTGTLHTSVYRNPRMQDLHQLYRDDQTGQRYREVKSPAQGTQAVDGRAPMWNQPALIYFIIKWYRVFYVGLAAYLQSQIRNETRALVQNLGRISPQW